jgi:asparagine synthase (glutamine-hydrolysing)
LGGDELFGGYRSFQKVPQMVRFAKKFQSIAPLMAFLGQGLQSLGSSPRAQRLGDFFQEQPTTTSAYGSFRGIFSHQEACLIASHYLSESPIFSRKQLHKSIPSSPSFEDEVSFLELNNYMRNQLLRDSDVMSMAWGLELRVPLVHRALLETISSIPSEIRLAPNKQLLTQSIPELPRWVVNQPKRGFFFPFQKWIEQEWQDYFQITNLPKQISLKLWYRRWSLAILQHWWESISK